MPICMPVACLLLEGASRCVLHACPLPIGDPLLHMPPCCTPPSSRCPLVAPLLHRRPSAHPLLEGASTMRSSCASGSCLFPAAMRILRQLEVAPHFLEPASTMRSSCTCTLVAGRLLEVARSCALPLCCTAHCRFAALELPPFAYRCACTSIALEMPSFCMSSAVGNKPASSLRTMRNAARPSGESFCTRVASKLLTPEFRSDGKSPTIRSPRSMSLVSNPSANCVM